MKSAMAFSEVHSVEEAAAQDGLTGSYRARRISAPFILSQDLARGAYFAFQALLAYLLMLAVMCVSSRSRSRVSRV